MKNTLPVEGGVRQPRAMIRINGVNMTGWEHWSADLNTFHDPDKCSATFAASALPQGYGLDWWASQTDLEIEILAGFPADPANFTANDLTSVFFGDLDDVSVQWDGLTVEVTGRDKSHQLVDTKSEEKYRNQTASQIATLLAQKYGLTPVITATTTPVGHFYATDHVDLQSDRTEWDLLTWLGRQEGFRTYVKGKELHFEPYPTGSGDPYVIRYDAATDAYASTAFNAVTLKTMRVLTVAKDLSVTVTSWTPGKDKQAYSRVARRQRSAGSSKVQQYSYRIAGLTPQQCQDRANQILDEISRHEMRIELTGPADVILGIADTIQVEGTGTAFDQTYYPDAIRLEMGFESTGFSWTVSGKNHDPESEPAL